MLNCLEYCKTVYFRCILISQFWNVEISLQFNLAFSRCSTSIYQALTGKLNFSGYLILQFYPTREICEKFDACEKYVLQYHTAPGITIPILQSKLIHQRVFISALNCELLLSVILVFFNQGSHSKTFQDLGPFVVEVFTRLVKTE